MGIFYSLSSIFSNVNQDGDHTVLDVIALHHCSSLQNANHPFACWEWCEQEGIDCHILDMNADGGINVIDIVNLSNCMVAGSCGG